MGSIEGRLSRLEEQAGLRRAAADEEGEKAAWLATARARRVHELSHRPTWRARDVIRLLQLQGRLGATTEEVREQVLAWKPPIERGAVERALAQAIYRQEDGCADLVCDPAWRESFEAGDELLRRILAAPDAELAESFVRLRRAEEAGDEEAKSAVAQRLGLDDELVERAVGPDFDETTDAERDRRLAEYLGDFLYGERGYEVSRLMERIEKGEPSAD